jgi:hypothetical protein
VIDQEGIQAALEEQRHTEDALVFDLVEALTKTKWIM